MYNRYVRNDNGEYRRINVAQEHTVRSEKGIEPEVVAKPGGQLNAILSKLRLDEIDTGDLLLLVLLFLLFREGEDEELLIALGLLLIM